MWKFRMWQTVLGLGVCFILCLNAWAEIPNQISFQGILKDGEDNLVEDGIYSVVFSIYNALEDGGLLWTDTQIINTKNGLFNITLGDEHSIPDTAFNNDAYIAFAIEGQPELSPRIQLQSVPYSYKSKASEIAIESDRVDGYEGEDLEESQEIDDDIVQHTEDYGHLTNIQVQELTSGGFTTLHNHAFVPPENIFRAIVEPIIGQDVVAFTTPSNKIRYVTSITVCGNSYEYDFKIDNNIILILVTPLNNGTQIWNCGGAPLLVMPNENFSIWSNGMGYRCLITGYEFDYEP